MAQSKRAERHRPAAIRYHEFRRSHAERICKQAMRDAEAFWFRLR